MPPYLIGCHSCHTLGDYLAAFAFDIALVLFLVLAWWCIRRVTRSKR